MLLVFDEYLYSILTSCWENTVTAQFQNWGALVQSFSQLWEGKYIWDTASRVHSWWKILQNHLLPRVSHDLRVKPIASRRFHWGLKDPDLLRQLAFLKMTDMNWNPRLKHSESEVPHGWPDGTEGSSNEKMKTTGGGKAEERANVCPQCQIGNQNSEWMFSLDIFGVRTIKKFRQPETGRFFCHC